jgi:alpha/beta superfamily hydrolase
MTTSRPLALRTGDGLTLEAELAVPALPDADPRAAVVLCHPHPQYGGSMRSIVISVLFDALPRAGYACLRFNFRGVEGSGGAYAEGVDEPLDIIAAIDAIATEVPGPPIVLVAWSFGADMALQVTDARVAGWVAIAPPLRFRSEFPVASDPRAKHLILGEHDEYRAPADVQQQVAAWSNTTTAVVAGASHFFVGRTDGVTNETQVGIDRAVR